MPIVLASAKSPYSDTMAAIAGKTARSAKNATPPEVDMIRSAEIDQSTRQRDILPSARRDLLWRVCFAPAARFPGTREIDRTTRITGPNLSAPVMWFVGDIRRRGALDLQEQEPSELQDRLCGPLFGPIADTTQSNRDVCPEIRLRIRRA